MPPIIPPINDPSLSLPRATTSRRRIRISRVLSGTLQSITDDSRALHESDLSTAERTRLALHIRALGERLPALTVGQPGSVRRGAFEIDRLSGRLLAAVARGDSEGAARESEAITAAISAAARGAGGS